MQRLWMAALVVMCATGASAQPGNVDDERLLNAQSDPSNWVSYGRDYGNRRFSPLARIDAKNVADLAPVWSYRSGVESTFQATPIVVDGVMYVSLPFNHVVALDARDGRLLWRYQHERRTKKMCCGPANRGVAVAYGKVFIGTVDARLIALDQATGVMVWDVPLVEELGGPAEQADQLAADDPLRRGRVTGMALALCRPHPPTHWMPRFFSSLSRYFSCNPRALAAAARFPRLCASALITSCLRYASMDSRYEARSDRDSGWAATILAGRSWAAISGPWARTTARSMALASSRMFPGHS